jgi:endonuclease-3 related protein
MSELSRLQHAASLLRTAYGTPELPSDESSWSRCLATLFGVTAGHPASAALNELLSSGPLASPDETVNTVAGRLAEQLQPIPRGPQKASVVRALAAWWITQFGNDCSPQWSASVQSYRESLRPIRGLGPAVVDELLLFGARLRVFPVDRTALRVAVRHGWLDLPIEDEDAQSFYVGRAGEGTDNLMELSRLLTKVGEAHCGREPNCEGCPLQSMLPEGGPRNPLSC